MDDDMKTPLPKRFHRLPDAPLEKLKFAEERAKTCDKQAKLHLLDDPKGPHLETDDEDALVMAIGCLGQADQRFKL